MRVLKANIHDPVAFVQVAAERGWVSSRGASFFEKKMRLPVWALRSSCLAWSRRHNRAIYGQNLNSVAVATD